MEFNIRLKQIRKQRGLTQKELGKMINTYHQKIQRFESGKNEPDLKDFFNICDVLNVSADYLIGFDNRLPFPKI